MRQRIHELTLMTALCLLLYYLYWIIADESFIERAISNRNYPFMRIVMDALVCWLLTYISTVYSNLMIQLMDGHETLQKINVVPTLVLFILDMVTAWCMSELSQRMFCESDLLVYFQDIFVFGILATLVSSIKINTMFWQRKMEMEHERVILENKVVEAERVMSKSRLHNLQAQVNPHFFFNNLSALSSLISINPIEAKDFVSVMAQMYRHILQNMKQELVPLEKELELVNEYTKLLRMRHGESVRINLPDIYLICPNAFVPPVSIQHLVENAVKHNAMTAASPLTINISIYNEKINVCNNIQPLSGTPTHSGTGLANLREQLKLFGVAALETNIDSESFSVTFPLIIKNKSHENNHH